MSRRLLADSSATLIGSGRFLGGKLRCAKWIRLLGKNHSAPPPTLPSKNRKKFIFFLSKSTSIDYLLIFFIQKLV